MTATPLSPTSQQITNLCALGKLHSHPGIRLDDPGDFAALCHSFVKNQLDLPHGRAYQLQPVTFGDG